MNKYVIVSKSTDAVICVSNVATQAANGLDVGDMILSNPKNLGIYTVDESWIPTEIQKYKYTPATGFVQDPNWKPSESEVIADLKNQIAQLHQDDADYTSAILDIYNILLGG